ncbi:MAG: glycogen synthase GlgA [Armatimonadota bacterium]
MARSLKVLIVSAEVAPLAKVGGLADVAGALPKALRAMGHDVRIAMPCYRMIEKNPEYPVRTVVKSLPVPINPMTTEEATIRRTNLKDGTPVYLVGHHRYFTEATESKKIYALEPEPYIFFDRTIPLMLEQLNWIPDIIHANDWHTGFVPVYIRVLHVHQPEWQKVGLVFTIHNLAYQGEFGYDLLWNAGLPEWLFHYERLEFYGRVNFLKGGIVYSDVVNTVSKTYAKEIQTPEYGCRMEGLLQYIASQGRLEGIVNGMDYEEYNPATDPRISAHYSADDPSGKALCKEALQKECGFVPDPNTPVMSMITRLADQKGLDLVAAIAKKILDLGFQFVVLGTGDPRYEQLFTELANKNPQQVKAFIGFDPDLAQRIYAGSDLFLMPSRFEPCGLGQLMALRYGTIPIVRKTGGLADTIADFSPRTGKGNGFVFEDYDSAELLKAIKRALKAYQQPEVWHRLVDSALRSDYSWQHAAGEYTQLYLRALERRSASLEAA